MRAVVCESFGPTDTLRLTTREPSAMEPGSVRVRVHACGVNFPDILIVEGKYQQKPTLPFSPGGEIAGVITEIADDVSALSVGDRVMATIFWGGMCEDVVVPQHAVFRIPEQMDFTTASVFQGGHTTVYHALKQRAQLKADENLVVLGAAGGIGIAAVQLGKAMGARVIAVASTDEKCAACIQQGADEAINYSRAELKSAINDLTGGRGADVLLDPVGGDAFDAACRSMNYHGRILVVGFTSGRIPTYATNLALLKSCSLVGVNYLAFFGRDRVAVEDNFRELTDMYARGAIAPSIDRIFPLEEAAKALDYVGQRRAIGKVVVTVSP